MITFLLTDIEGSTRLVEALGEEYRSLLATHHRLLGEAATRSGGTLHGTEGDALFFWFEDAESAVAAAAAGQRALAAYPWPTREPVRVRMGIHSGEGAIENGEPIGLGIHRAARICAIGHGEQVLASDSVKAGAPGYSFKDLGARRLKDFDEPVRVHQLLAPGLRETFPPLRPSQPAKQRRVLVLAGALVAIAIIAAARMLAPGSQAVPIKANSVVAIDPERGKVLDDIPVGQAPIDVAFGAGRVWVIHRIDQTGTAIDAGTRKTVRTFSTLRQDDSIAAGPGGVLASRSNGSDFLGSTPSLGERIDPDYYDSQPIQVPGSPTRCGTVCWSPFAVAIGGAGAWEAANLGTVQIDLATRKVIRTVSEVAPQIGSLAVGDTTVWVIESQSPGGGGTDGGVYAITASAASSETPLDAPVDVASDGASAWILTADDVLDHVDQHGRLVAQTTLAPGKGVAVTVGGGYVWTATDAGDVSQIDPATLQRTKTIHLHRKTTALTYGNDTIWAAVL